MKGAFRVVRNSFWYILVMVLGHLYFIYVPLDGFWLGVGLGPYALIVYLAVSKARQILRF